MPPRTAEPDLLGGMGAAAPAPPAAPPTGDLFGGSSDMDDLMGLAAPPALVPTASAPASRVASSSCCCGMGGSMGASMPSAGSCSVPDDLAMFMGGAAPPATAATAPGGLDLMGGMGGGSTAKSNGAAPPDLIGGEPDLFGNAAAVVPRPGEPPERAALRAKHAAEKQAAIDEKVRTLREAEQKAESNRETERTLEKEVKARVAQWQRDKKNLRALLASLHEIAPPTQWKPVTLAQLLDPAAVKKAYHRSLIAVHPDKQPAEDIEKKVLAQHIFDALRDSWHVFEQTG